MNLGHHVRVLWNHRGLALVGLLIGLALAFLAAFEVPSMERRGSESWSSQSKILVTQAGFPEGRVTLPGAVTEEGAPTGAQDGAQKFADPGRLSSLALLYSVIALSDQVRGKLEQRPQLNQIQAVALDPTGNGQNFLPVILLTTTAETAAGAKGLNESAYASFRKVLESQQDANDIPASERIRLTVLERPAEATLISGYSTTPSILAFGLCALSVLAAAHILEGLSLRQTFAAVGGATPIVSPQFAAEGAPEPATAPDPAAAPAAHGHHHPRDPSYAVPEQSAGVRQSTPSERREAKTAERRRRRREAAERRGRIEIEGRSSSNGAPDASSLVASTPEHEGSASPNGADDASERADGLTPAARASKPGE